MFLLIFSAAAFARPLEPEAVSSSEALPLYVPEDLHGCSLQVNPAMLRSESARQHWLRATSEANARVRGVLLDQAKHGAQGDGAGTGASVVSAPRPSSGPPVLRFDAAGNVILRLGFLVSPKALMRYGQARLERDSAKAVVSVNQHFSDSGVGVVFEWAGVETYTGMLDETNLVLSELHAQVTAVDKYHAGFVPGNYEALLAYRATHQVNLAVLLALPVIPNSSATALPGRPSTAVFQNACHVASVKSCFTMLAA